MLERLRQWINQRRLNIIRNAFTKSLTVHLSDEKYYINQRCVLSVKLADTSDIEAMVAIQKNCYDGDVPWQQEILKRELMYNPSSLYIIVYDQQHPVAFIGAWIQRSECHVTNIATIPEYRRLGIGTFLLRQLTDIAYQKKVCKMTLEVRMTNTTAKKLYETNGFQTQGMRAHYYADQEDALTMLKWLKGEHGC